MKPESQAWEELRRHAASQLSPGFADRVLRAARQGVEAAPSVFSQFALSAATAALCYVALVLFQARHSSTDGDHSMADWQEIAYVSTADPGPGQ